MDDKGHRENGRHKTDQYRAAQNQYWLMHQPSMKQIMALMAERDAAIQERNSAVSEKKAAIAERDMAFLQRDAAIAERNSALIERDNAINNLQCRENTLVNGSTNSCPPGCQISRGLKHIHHPQQNVHNLPHVNQGTYGSREIYQSVVLPVTPSSPEAAKSRQGKQPKGDKVKDIIIPSNKEVKKASKPSKKVKKETEDLNKLMYGEQDIGGGGSSGDLNKQLVTTKTDWKSQDLGLNQIVFDETTMPPPGCSCTGILRQCYKWGNGGWQSSCCTTSISTYPLPMIANKRHSRVGGRKMSGGAFSKLLSRLSAEGHDLSSPVDLKDHWAKHGTNRYITIK